MRIQKATLEIPITLLTENSPLPAFRDRTDRPIRDGGLLPEEKPGFARETGFRALPYAMQDNYEPVPVKRDIPCILLENRHLRATFLPTLGGRLYSLWDKDADRELLFCNPVIKMGNLALRNAWFSGGIEWNFGHYGHTFFTCEDVFFAACEQGGDRFLRMYTYERCKRLTFQVDFHLPEGASHLSAHMRIVNPREEPVPIFLWTNAAVVDAPGARVFSGTEEVIIQCQSPVPGESFFAHGTLPDPLGDGVDHTYPSRIPCAEEYFFQNPADAGHAFESILYPDGGMVYERSTGNYPFRKVFFWGAHRGGKRWQEHLSRPGEGAYLEIQAGLFRTQQHAGYIGAGETLSLTQMFGGARAPYGEYTGEYAAARRRMRSLVDELLPASAVKEEHVRCAGLATLPAEVILHRGTGWGALEALRDTSFLPAHLCFPEDGIGAEQAPWAALLKGERFLGADSFMTAPEWLPVFEAALPDQRDNAALLTQYGIALYENGAWDAAEAVWQEAVRIRPEPLALRCLAYAARASGNREQALSFMERAVGALSAPQRAYAEEYLALLIECGLQNRAYAFYRSLPAAMQKGERLSITASFAALSVGDEAFLDEQFSRTFSVVKEGEMEFIDLWFRLAAMREARKRGVPLTEDLLSEVRKTRTLPHHLDFRMLRE